MLLVSCPAGVWLWYEFPYRDQFGYKDLGIDGFSGGSCGYSTSQSLMVPVSEEKLMPIL